MHILPEKKLNCSFTDKIDAGVEIEIVVGDSDKDGIDGISLQHRTTKRSVIRKLIIGYFPS